MTLVVMVLSWICKTQIGFVKPVFGHLCYTKTVICPISAIKKVMEAGLVGISYKKLWKLLIDKGMYKKDLRMAAGLSTNVIANMGKGKDVSTESLRKICAALDCDISDILEFVKDET